MQRRAFVTLLGGVAGWPLALRAQQAMPVIGFLGIAQLDAVRMNAFRRGLSETGYVEGQNPAVEFRYAEGRYDQFPGLAADLVHRQVSAIVTPGITAAALAAKSATSSIPIIFGVGGDPVKLGLVESLGRPGGNATGVNFFTTELVGKRLGLLHQLLPGSARIAVLVNPTNPTASGILKETEAAFHGSVQPVEVISASTNEEINQAFAVLW